MELNLSVNMQIQTVPNIFFTNAFVRDWNRLPPSVVQCSSIDSLKNRFDCYLLHLNVHWVIRGITAFTSWPLPPDVHSVGSQKCGQGLRVAMGYAFLLSLVYELMRCSKKFSLTSAYNDMYFLTMETRIFSLRKVCNL